MKLHVLAFLPLLLMPWVALGILGAAGLIAGGCASSPDLPPPAPAPVLVQDDPHWREHPDCLWCREQCWLDIEYRCVGYAQTADDITRCQAWDGSAPAPVDAGCAW